MAQPTPIIQISRGDRQTQPAPEGGAVAQALQPNAAPPVDLDQIAGKIEPPPAAEEPPTSLKQAEMANQQLDNIKRATDGELDQLVQFFIDNRRYLHSQIRKAQAINLGIAIVGDRLKDQARTAIEFFAEATKQFDEDVRAAERTEPSEGQR